MNLSNIIGKQVFDIFSGEIIGTIHDANFNFNYTKLLGIYFFDNEENEYYIKRQNIYSIKDFLTIKNNTKVSQNFVLSENLSPLGKNIVSVFGDDYGTLCDIEFDDKFNITNFVSTKNKKIEPQKIISISKSMIVGFEIKMCSFRPRKKVQIATQNLNNLAVSIMKIEDTQQTNQKLMPSKITVNSDVLVGKKLSKDIYGKNNELILKQNQVLSLKNIMLAKQHDKLNELFYSAY